MKKENIKINRLKSKLKKFYKLFIKPPKIWRLPNKSEIILHDASGLEVFETYFSAYSVEVISLRGESVNILCLLRAMLKPCFWKGKPIDAYVDAYIEFVLPKVVITFIDNNPSFYTISNRFPDIKTIFVQNGVRGGGKSFFEPLVHPDENHVDYMLVFTSSFGKECQKYISGKAIAIGSFKSNNVKKSLAVSGGYILFLSEYRKKSNNDQPYMILQDKSAIYWDEFYATDVRVLKFLSTWCAKNNKLLKVAGCSVEQKDEERDFYETHLNVCNFEFMPKEDIYSSYRAVDAAEIVVFLNSTLGFESIGRGNKTASLSCRGTLYNDNNFWSAVLPNNGAFWTNDADEKQFQRIMDYLNTVSDKEWELTRKLYVKELMDCDIGNTRFVALLGQLLSEEENLSFNK